MFYLRINNSFTLNVLPSTIRVTSNNLSEQRKAFNPCNNASECEVNIKFGAAREYLDEVEFSAFVLRPSCVLLRSTEAAPPAIFVQLLLYRWEARNATVYVYNNKNKCLWLN